MATTLTDLLERSRHTVTELQRSDDPVTRQQWDAFDHTLYRLLHELVHARVGWRNGNPNAIALRRAVHDYPQPLQPADDRPDFTPREAARLLGLTEIVARNAIRDGTLLAAATSTGYRIPRSEVTRNETIHPARGDDPHPLARTSCAIGALTDVLVTNRMDPATPELRPETAVTLAKQVLLIAGAAATRTLSICDPEIADRPLAIAQYVSRTAPGLTAGAAIQGLQNHRTPSPSGQPLSDADELDLTIHQWASAARGALRDRVPSIDVIKDINRQAVHLYAALDSLLVEEPDVRRQLRSAAITLQSATEAWSQTTTCTPPSQDYVNASRRLYADLTQVINLKGAALASRENTYQALLRGAGAVASLTPQITPTAARLLESEALFIHARHANPTTRRLRASLAGRTVTATHTDVPGLPVAQWEAQRATARVIHMLPPTRNSQQPSSQLQNSIQL